MAGKRQRRIPAYGGTYPLAREFAEALLECMLHVCESRRVAVHTERLLGDVPEEVADVERRIAHAEQVEVDDAEPIAVHDHLLGVEVAMDGPPARRRQSAADSFAFTQETPYTRVEPRLHRCDVPQTRLKDAQLVARSVLAPRRDVALVNLVRSFGNSPCERGATRVRQQIRRGRTGNLPLQPHAEAWNRCDGLRHRDPVRARRREPGTPQLVGELVVLFSVPARADLAQHSNTPPFDARTLDAQVVFDETAAAGFVPDNADASKADDPVLAREPRQAVLELTFDLAAIERSAQRGERRIANGCEVLVGRHHEAAMPDQSETKPSTWRVSENRCSTRRRAAAPRPAAKRVS